MPWTGPVGQNGPVTSAGLVGRLRAWARLVLRPSGSLPPLTLRGQIFDVAVVLFLGLAAAVAGTDQDRNQQVQWNAEDSPPGYREPPPPPPFGVDEPPFLPIEQDQAWWPLV